MTFLQGLLLVAAKELRHLRHDPYTLLLTIAVPLSQMLLFGYALDTRVRQLPLVVQNLDGQRYSRTLIDAFQKSGMFRLTSETPDESELLTRLRRGQATIALQIPAGYSNAAFHHRPAGLRVWIDGSDAAKAAQALIAAQAIGLDQAITLTFGDIRGNTVPLEIRPQLLFNPSGRPVNFFVPALVATLLETTTMLLVALSFVKERERGTLDQLRVTIISLPSLIAGKLAASAVAGLGTGLILMGIMRYVFFVPIAGNPWLFLAALFLFVPPAVGLGLIVTAEARNQFQALQMTFLVAIPSIMLSGFVFPRETMPQVAVALGGLLPSTWSIQITRGIALRGAGVEDLAPALAGSALLGILYVTLGALHLRRRLR